MVAAMTAGSLSPILAPAIGAVAVIEAAIATGAAAIAGEAALGAAGGFFYAAITNAGAAAAALAGAGATAGAAVAVGSAAGPIIGTFWLASVGADGYTWDCWKPVVLDESTTPSSGMAFRDLYQHPNIRRITADRDGFDAENIRGEHFRISPVIVNGALAFHATQA